MYLLYVDHVDLIVDQVYACYWKLMCVGYEGPHVSQLLFAYDLIFAEENV